MKITDNDRRKIMSMAEKMGAGKHRIKFKGYDALLRVENWSAVCCEDACEEYYDDEEKFDECCLAEAERVTWGVIPDELREMGYKPVFVSLEDLDIEDAPYGASVILGIVTG